MKEKRDDSDIEWKRSRKTGLPPGSLIHIGKKIAEKERITVIDYDENDFSEKEVDNIEECFKYKETNTITWINIDGLHNPEIIDKIGDHFGVHPLVLEDILNTNQRPKVEDYDDYIFIVIKMLTFKDQKLREVESEQVSMILGKNFVISFQETIGDIYDVLRERLRKNKGRIRKMRSDYLAYTLIDTTVDYYFSIIEVIGEEVEDLQNELIKNPKNETLQKLYKLKKQMILLRKSIWPLREVMSSLSKSDSALVHKETKIFMRDVYDHAIQVIDNVETFREMASEMIDIYLSSMSNKLNEVMKVLTIISTIFIPLTFITGIYGMNFGYMPELGWHGGYFAILGVMALIAGFMIVYFKRKKWL